MILSVLTFLPLVFCFLVAFLPNDKTVRTVALIGSLIEFALSVFLLMQFDGGTHHVQMVEKHAWLPAFGINYFLGIDGISLWLVLLTTFLTPIIVLGSWAGITEKVKSFHAALLFLETAMIGTFLAFDAVLFYMFWEAMLIPMYIMIGVWGGPRRVYAAVKFFIFTMAGSVFMLLAVVALMYYTKEQQGVLSANILDFYRLKIPFAAQTFLNPQTLMFSAFALAFAIKVPMFPLHTWLPDAHVEAPTAGSVILAGVLLKMGTYGFLRFAIPLFPDAVDQYAPLFIGLAVFGIVYGALVAMVQSDIKKLVAYSSVSHLGYVMLGLFALNIEGATGGLYQMLNHGISTGALFLLVGMIYERTHSREISKYGGLASALPLYTIAFVLVTMSSIAVPGTNGFVGEFLILLGAFKNNRAAGLFAVSGVILGAAYMLWMVKRVFFGSYGELVPHRVAWGAGHHDDHGGPAQHIHDYGDLNKREVLLLIPLVVLIFWMGVYSNTFLDKSRASLEFFVNNRSNYHLTVEEKRAVAELKP